MIPPFWLSPERLGPRIVRLARPAWLARIARAHAVMNPFLHAERPEAYMDLALKEARKALEVNEVPVGAVVVDLPSGRVIARAHNQRELLQDPTAHAEVVAITQAAAHYGSWRLVNAALFVTLEPCVMCAGAIVLSRIPKVFYGADDPKAGAHRSVFQVLVHPGHNHRPEVVPGIRAEEAGDLLRRFFQAKRKVAGGNAIRGATGPAGAMEPGLRGSELEASGAEAADPDAPRAEAPAGWPPEDT